MPGFNSDFEDTVALVTGSSRGIGAATARLLGERGADVVVNYNSSADAADTVVDYIRTAEGEGDAIAIQADVRVRDDVDAMVAEAESTFGTVDVLVNNANMSFPFKPFLEQSWAEFSAKFQDELRAAYNCTQATAPAMADQGYGRIVYVSSEAARNPQPTFSAHTTAKAGLNGLARAVATELGGEGIIANVVSPGLVRTEASEPYRAEFDDEVRAQTPLGRIAEPEDAARAIAVFASDDAQFVTGTYTPVNGGLTVE
ncbi:3-oxoacyl-[acyl-carrier-protein] reductase [Natronomonas moolapensis 8.8.11]|uniref:3-oxoacyl-[acyl-carrier-protein] reductase n=1 Tax=Natronomonas moolapensis (strain DSM 18674 / CECT 7526 / JCM 14361 / 8.8.11) TaxID=268739 RepID=M1XQX7_NATM8|nr:SDR family oxidoreductase [Natronomonas moolapensis]CCQ36584.1 3-oxoacyl-[acyl-carrier-protein] reductase [Natronomonas moolapensis 8.8.11]